MMMMGRKTTRSFEWRKTSPVETNLLVYENDDQENTNLNYIHNDIDKRDNDFHQPHIDQPKLRKYIILGWFLNIKITLID